ncbi:60S ribosomal protein L27B [Balamuthia mandrillaris]
MPKFLKPGKVVILLNGRYAGKKALIVDVNEDGSKDRPYGHAIVAGIDKYPLKVTKSMGKKKIAKRSRVKPFVKVVNFNHMMPTRYGIADLDLKDAIKTPQSLDKGQKPRTRAQVKKAFQARYLTGKNKWFFTKLRF